MTQRISESASVLENIQDELAMKISLVPTVKSSALAQWRVVFVSWRVVFVS